LPPGTLTANLVGAYVIGFLVELLALRSKIPPEVALFAITGYLGALTTFSTFSVEAVTIFARREYFWAICHVISHLVGSLMMTVLGIVTCQRLLS
jgi:CrcB protein